MSPQQHRSPILIRRLAVLAVAVGLIAAACSSDDDGTETSDGGEVVVITHDSFQIDDELVAAFESETGLILTVQRGGDAIEVVNQAILTVDDPQGDVLFGIDDATLGRALDADLFEPYVPERLADVDDDLIVDPEGRATPVDHGAVCINYDAEWFDAEGLEPPASLDELRDEAYADLLVVPNPASSSPGLAFLTATVAEFGDDGWVDYWSDLRANGVVTTAGWSDAYYGRFSGGSGEGDRPLVVSYGSSPPAEVMEQERLPEEGPTGVIESTCVRQIELAGVLSNAANPEGARRFIDFLLGDAFQASVPLSMFVYPVVDGVELPEVFQRFAVVPSDPYRLDPQVIAAERDEWISTWTDTVQR
ncbi:MAG: thiamine ABC transporter substrate-binding protein [Acidimicrobiia bacterium]|nr:thiamine ABC transporter substrate-binding protein [Acidimicrobiia bacterium]